MRHYLFLFLMLPAVVFATDIYQTKDSDGNPQFSDQPAQGATKVELRPLQIYKAPDVKQQQQATEAAKKAEHTYKAVSVTQPTPDLTVRNNLGVVPVMLAVEPKLNPEDRIVLFIDGKPIGDPLGSNNAAPSSEKEQTAEQYTMTLNGVYRGAHTLVAKVLSPKDDILIESTPVTFFMKIGAV